jgi:hypothetical protein
MDDIQRPDKRQRDGYALGWGPVQPRRGGSRQIHRQYKATERRPTPHKGRNIENGEAKGWVNEDDGLMNPDMQDNNTTEPESITG